MARKTEITLGNIGFVVRKERQQMIDPRGNPIFGDTGLPKLADLWVLDLIDQRPDGVEIIHVPFDEAAKETLVAQFTGGVVVADRMPTSPASI
jgi:hypothetical protein